MTELLPLDPAAEREWSRLRIQLEFAAGFWLGFAFLVSPKVSRILEQRTERMLHVHARVFTLVEINVPADADRALNDLLTASPGAGCTWVRCVQPRTKEWEPAIGNLFLRLNERRDALRRRLSAGGLVFALHPSIKPLVRDAAPDLWSVRSLVLEPGAVPAAPADRIDAAARRQDESEEVPASRVWSGTPVSPGPVRGLLTQVANLLDEDRPDDAVDAGHRALAAVVPGTTPPSDEAATLTWVSRAEEVAGDDGAAADHAERALALVKAGEEPLRAELLDRVARLAERRQDLDAAKAARGALVDQARAAAMRSPADEEVLRTLSDALEGYGNVLLDLGELTSAREVYEEALELDRRLLDVYGESARALRNVSVSLNELGAALAESGELMAARAAYEESLGLARRLVEVYGESPGALRDVLVSLIRVGDVLRVSGELAAARAVYEESLGLARRLVEVYGESPGALRDVSVSLDRVGDVLGESGELAAARAVYEESLGLRRRLVEVVGGSPGALRDVSVSLDRVGDVLGESGELAAARAVYEESLGLRRRLVEVVGGSPGALRDVSVSLEKVGDVLGESGELAAARAVYEESLGLRRRLVEVVGGSPGALRDVSVSLNRVGDVLRESGDLRAACAAYEEALELDRRRVSAYGELPEALRDLSVSLRKVAGIEAELGHAIESKAAADEAEAIAERLGS